MSANEKFPLSVVVITKNEEDNVEACLASVAWASEIIVVDDFSSDKTVELVSKFTDKIIKRRMDNEGIHRNYAYQLSANEWVLSLDADEIASPELKEEIMNTLPANTKFTAFSIPLRNYIGNYWVKYGGWYPAGKLRLFKKDKFKYEEVGVHPRVFLDGVCGHLTKDIIHKGYPDIEHFMSSVNRQTTLEAQKWIQTNRKMGLGKALWRTFDRFIRSFFTKKGYKDGIYGFTIALFASFYQILSYVKYRVMLKESSARHCERTK